MRRSLPPLLNAARSLHPRRPPRALSAFKALHTTLPRHAQLTPQGSTSTYINPDHMSTEHYAAPAFQTISILSRAIKYLIYTTLGISGVAFGAFEAWHLYVENVLLSAPSRVDDEYGWQDEVPGWTGGVRGGTDPKLGWKARHALRGAWICQEWGAGSSPAAIGKSNSSVSAIHPDYLALRGMIGTESTNRVDRGYEMADEYIDVAIATARRKGMVFPPTLSVTRSRGPQIPTTTIRGDSTAVDLLLLKAGILERIATMESLHEAKEVYETVFSASQIGTTTQQAKAMRLAGKVGDLCVRIGDENEARDWWGWGLRQVGVEMPVTLKEEVKQGVEQEVKQVRGWFSSKPKTQRQDLVSQVHNPPSVHTSSPVQSTSSLNLSPPILRATISLLISAETHAARTSHLGLASSLQNTALALLPSPHPLRKPAKTTAAQDLHDTWLQHRSALLQTHHAAVLTAQNQPAMETATLAHDRAETVVSAIEPIPTAYTTSFPNPTKILHRDALLTAAEAAYTRGLLLERSQTAQLDVAAELFERAMTLSALESGRTDEAAMGEDWQRYYRGFARVKGKMGIQ